MFLSLIKLIAVFIFIYFLYSLFKMIIRVSSSLKNNVKSAGNKPKSGSGKNEKIIELDKDQYKVE